MNILVTGAAGFIGSNLCHRLVKQGHKVWAVDNFLTGSHDNLDSLKENDNFTFFICGVETDKFAVFCNDTHVKFDQVYHLACPTGVPNIEILGEEIMDVCSVGTKNVLQVAYEHKARLVFTSSSEIYGDPEVFPQSEEYAGRVDPIGWRANYEEGKRFSETWLKLFVKKYGLNASIVRLFNVYGPKMSLLDFRVIPRLATQALSSLPLTVHGQGDQMRTLCFVDDLVNGLLIVMEKGEPGEAYNLGSDKAISIFELAEKVIAASGSSSKILFTPRASHDPNGRMPVLDKVHALGWQQTVSLEEGLKLTIEDFKQRLIKNNSTGVEVNNFETKSFLTT